jgi:hypothetical protein
MAAFFKTFLRMDVWQIGVVDLPRESADNKQPQLSVTENQG